jgi:hypothetical protein
MVAQLENATYFDPLEPKRCDHPLHSIRFPTIFHERKLSKHRIRGFGTVEDEYQGYCVGEDFGQVIEKRLQLWTFRSSGS